MVRDDWVVGGDRRALAAERIYAAATDLIVRDGLDAFDIDTLAATVHCSRATIYRYAGGKAQIRDAVVLRFAARIIDTVRRAVDGLSGPERVVKAITVALEQIRSDPMRRLMLDSTAADDLGDLALLASPEPPRRRPHRHNRRRSTSGPMDRPRGDVARLLANQQQQD